MRHIRRKVFNSLRRKKFNPLSHRKISSLWDIEKTFNSLRFFFFFEKIESYLKKKVVHFLESYLKKFNSESHIREKSSILWGTLKKQIQFFEPYLEKGSILCGKKRKKFNALRQIRTRLNSLSQIIKGSILWVLIEKQFFESYLKQGSILLSHIEKQERFNSSSHVKKSFNFEFYFFFFLKKKFKFMTIFQPQISFSESHSRKWDRFIESCSNKSEFDSLSHSQKKRGSILWIILNKKVQFFESYSSKNSILWVKLKEKKVQFFESYSKRGSILWLIFNKKGSSQIKKEFNPLSLKINTILWVKLKKKFQLFESYWKTRKVQFFASYWKKTSTLWITLRRGS